MGFIDGVVIAVPDANRDSYASFARVVGELFVECGADEVVDTWGVDVPEGKLTSFPMAVQRQPGETVVFSWIMWPDRETREKGWPKAMEDPRMTGVTTSLFDGKRMIFGGFEVIHATRKGD